MFPNTLPTKIISIVQFRILLDIFVYKKKQIENRKQQQNDISREVSSEYVYYNMGNEWNFNFIDWTIPNN